MQRCRSAIVGAAISSGRLARLRSFTTNCLATSAGKRTIAPPVPTHPKEQPSTELRRSRCRGRTAARQLPSVPTSIRTEPVRRPRYWPAFPCRPTTIRRRLLPQRLLEQVRQRGQLATPPRGCKLSKAPERAVSIPDSAKTPITTAQRQHQRLAPRADCCRSRPHLVRSASNVNTNAAIKNNDDGDDVSDG